MSELPFHYLDMTQVIAATRAAATPAGIYRLIQRDEFPQGEKHGKRRLWRSDEIRQYNEDRSAKATQEREERDRKASEKGRHALRVRREKEALIAAAHTAGLTDDQVHRLLSAFKVERQADAVAEAA